MINLDKNLIFDGSAHFGYINKYSKVYQIGDFGGKISREYL